MSKIIKSSALSRRRVARGRQQRDESRRKPKCDFQTIRREARMVAFASEVSEFLGASSKPSNVIQLRR